MDVEWMWMCFFGSDWSWRWMGDSIGAKSTISLSLSALLFLLTHSARLFLPQNILLLVLPSVLPFSQFSVCSLQENMQCIRPSASVRWMRRGRLEGGRWMDGWMLDLGEGRNLECSGWPGQPVALCSVPACFLAPAIGLVRFFLFSIWPNR